MPEQKGRKRRPRDRRRHAQPPPRGIDAVQPSAPDAAQPSSAAPPRAATGSSAATRRGMPDAPRPAGIPSPTARATGFMIAVITVFLAVMMIADAPDAGGLEAVLRVIAGVVLALIAIAVGALVLFPAQLRRMIRGE